jgi:hypothetical protein
MSACVKLDGGGPTANLPFAFVLNITVLQAAAFEPDINRYESNSEGKTRILMECSGRWIHYSR